MILFQKSEIKLIQETGCLIYKGSRTRRIDRHPRVRFNGRKVQLHRVIYEEKYGPIPNGKEVHHTCENKSCINIEHLVALTKDEHRKIHMKSKCHRGHEYEGNSYINSNGDRVCILCVKITGNQGHLPAKFR